MSVGRITVSAQLPPRTVAVEVVVTVTPHSAAAAERILDCKLTLHDRAGRVWDGRSDSATGLYQTFVRCAAEDGPIPVGMTRTIRHIFVVPADVAADVELVVSELESLPRQLGFARANDG